MLLHQCVALGLHELDQVWQQIDQVWLSRYLNQDLSHLRAHYSQAIFVEFTSCTLTALTLMADLSFNSLELLEEDSIEGI